MTYNASIPQPTDLISNSQPQILTNFAQLNTQFGVDHIPFNNAGSNGDGTHKKVTVDAPLGADPTPTGNVSVVYTKAVSGVPQLFFANSAGASQITGAASGLVANGYTIFPGGLIMQWGSATVSTSGTTVNFPITFPSNVWSVVVTPVSNTSRGIAENTVTTSSFKCFAENNGTLVYFIAIGK